jgi:ankyrin repeat protein
MISTAVISNELLEAASKGTLSEIMRLIAAGANPDFRDVLDGGTSLHRTVGRGDLAATQFLLSCGANPNIPTVNTSTSPLGIAALAGNRELVYLLLAAKADLTSDEIATGLLMECRECGFADIANTIEAARAGSGPLTATEDFGLKDHERPGDEEMND